MGLRYPRLLFTTNNYQRQQPGVRPVLPHLIVGICGHTTCGAVRRCGAEAGWRARVLFLLSVKSSHSSTCQLVITDETSDSITSHLVSPEETTTRDITRKITPSGDTPPVTSNRVFSFFSPFLFFSISTVMTRTTRPRSSQMLDPSTRGRESSRAWSVPVYHTFTRFIKRGSRQLCTHT